MYYQRPLVFRIVESMCRHWRLFACTAIAIVALLAAYVITRPRTFNTQYTVVLNTDSIQNPLGTDQQQVDWNLVGETVDHFQTLLATKDFVKAALTNPDGTPLHLDRPINVNNDDAIEALQKGATAWSGGTDSFNVGMTYGDAQDSVVILKALIDEYIDQNAAEKSAFYTQQVAFISSQVDQYRDKLAKAEAAYTAFKKVNNQHLPSQQDAIESNLVTLQQTVQQDQVTLAEDQSREQFLTQTLAQTPKTIVGSQTSGVSPLDNQIRALEAQRDTDLSVSGMKESHPQVKALEAHISALKALIKKQAGSLDTNGITSTEEDQNPQYFQVASTLSGLKSDMLGLQTEIAQTQALVAKTQIAVGEVPEEELIEDNLQRDYKYDDEQYGKLYERLSQAHMDEQVYLLQQRSMYDQYLTEPPTSSTNKSKTALLFVGGIFIALLVAGSMVILSEALDRSFRDPYDLQRTLGVPVLAMLPESEDLHVADSRHPRLPGGGDRARLMGRKSAALLTGPTAAPVASAASTDADRNAGKANPSGFSAGPTHGVGGTV
jgi:hypothetical protein